MAIRERLDSLSRGELAGLVVVLVATLAGVGQASGKIKVPDVWVADRKSVV